MQLHRWVNLRVCSYRHLHSRVLYEPAIPFPRNRLLQEGGAVFSIKVDGVYHEFTAIPGIVEDVTAIILNIKTLSNLIIFCILSNASRLYIIRYTINRCVNGVSIYRSQRLILTLIQRWRLNTMWNRKLGRTADHRKAMLRNMATSLIINGQI